jgi:nitroreductase
MMNVLEAIHSKRAVRRYQERPLPPEAVRAILNAGRLSQSAKNLQPWRFIALQDRSRLAEFQVVGRFSEFLARAALGVVLLTPPPEERFQILFDAGQAAAYMQLAAWDLGIASCLTTSYAREAAREYLGAPPEWRVHIAAGFGYPLSTDPTRPPRPGGRKPFDDIVGWERWSDHLQPESHRP